VPGGGGTATVVCLNAGRYFETGSVSRIRPSSSRIATATVVTAFDIDAMRRITSWRIGRFFSTSIFPYVSKCTSFPARVMTVAIPAMRPSSTCCCITAFS